MSKVLVTESHLEDIADAIREQNGTENTYKPGQMAAAIRALEGGESVDISGKADKVSNATSGNFAALDSSGNLTDSGHKHGDYLTSHQNISGKADKVSGATSGNFAAFTSSGNLADSGNKPADFVSSSGGTVFGNLNVTGQYKRSGNPLLVVEQKSSGITCDANGANRGSITVTKTGYTPIGIVGFEISGGNAYMNISLYRLVIESSTSVGWSAKNNSTVSQNGTIAVQVLYMAD